MTSVHVYFPSIMAVKKFVESISVFDGHFDLVDGRCIVDARSLMGIFAMDLTVPIELRIEKDMKETLEAIESFIV
ncbi:MAG: HPr family phosphocarrier protein [Oscillospiraceae bacterium]|nr:HPr family phosphocarrier protein [Oscillospiraceae bacterium]